MHTWLQTKRSGLEDSRTGLGFSLTALDRELPLEPGGPLVGVPSTSKLSDLSAQLKPLLIVRKELTALLICLEEVGFWGVSCGVHPNYRCDGSVVEPLPAMRVALTYNLKHICTAIVQ